MAHSAFVRVAVGPNRNWYSADVRNAQTIERVTRHIVVQYTEPKLNPAIGIATQIAIVLGCRKATIELRSELRIINQTANDASATRCLADLHQVFVLQIWFAGAQIPPSPEVLWLRLSMNWRPVCVAG